MEVMGRSDSRGLAHALRGRVTDQRVLAAIAATPRTAFVPDDVREDAGRNAPLPIGCGQTISQPLVVAHMCELLELRGDERVLDIGTGSGWHAALLARLGHWVWTVERHPELAARAARALGASGCDNVTFVVGDGTLGHPDAAPYDAINVAAAARDGVPPELEEQLADRGRLVCPVGSKDQRLIVVRRMGHRFERRDAGPVRFVPLVAG
jgi:protein-L-isoaspartate(D-aspartate) O-methyltransferase